MPDRYTAMRNDKKLWLVRNAASGSNSDEALEMLELAFAEAGMDLVGKTDFPREKLPDMAMLDGTRVGLVAVFAGDGTINSTITHLTGWAGAVLVLPGGTMNLLSIRLHGHRSAPEIIADVGKGQARASRISGIRCLHGLALAGLMAGPGTSWCEVREAMRDGDVGGMAAGTVKALEESIAGAGIACRDPALGRPEGYPLLMFTPQDTGIEVEAYHAESAGDYLAQGWALLQRNFRAGPHDDLGLVQRLVIAGTTEDQFGLLIDGEPFKAGPTVELELDHCGVDLLATVPDEA
jgi:hypothetical protein